jgi:hypothetical protein
MFYWITKYENNPYQILLSCVAAQWIVFAEHSVWVGVDNAWEQEKLEARKMFVNRAESHTSGARFVTRM